MMLEAGGIWVSETHLAVFLNSLSLRSKASDSWDVGKALVRYRKNVLLPKWFNIV